jgi:hypothetical protein
LCLQVIADRNYAVGEQVILGRDESKNKIAIFDRELVFEFYRPQHLEMIF